MGITVEEMKMKLKKFAALLLAAVMTLSMAACTKEEGQSNDGGSKGGEEKDQLVLGTSADFAPYEFHKMVNGKDTILGFDVALAKKIAEEMDKELVIKDMDFNSLLNELNNGTVDFVAAGLSPDEERKKQVDFSDPYYSGEQCCIIRKEDARKVYFPGIFQGPADRGPDRFHSGGHRQRTVPRFCAGFPAQAAR